MNKFGLHRYAVAVSVWMFALVIVGSLVTTEGAGLSIPDWPLSFGRIFPQGPFSSNVLLALIHRALAAGALLLSAGLYVWALRSGYSRVVQQLSGVTALATALQIVLGGMAVLTNLSAWIGAIHGCLAQICLALAAMVAVMTSGFWATHHEYVHDYGWPSLRSLAIWIPALTFVQVTLGALFRHRIVGLVPHVVGAMLITGLVLLWTVFLLNQFPKHEALSRFAVGALLAMFVQLMLGVFTYMSDLSRDDQQAAIGNLPAAVITGHVVVGGVLLFLCVLLGFQVRRYVLPKLAPQTEIEAAS